MEIYDVIKDALLSFGFPIVMCFMLWFRMFKEDEKHDSEVKTLTEAINNNTRVIDVLSVKLDSITTRKE